MSPEVPEGGLALGELVRELPMPASVRGDAAVRVRGVRHDSRLVEPGDLFVARKGAVFDGGRFVRDAVARGAAAVLANADVAGEALEVPFVLVEDPQLAFGYVASAVYGHPSFSLEVVGVTGTNGKTTVTHLARAAIDGALGAPSCGVLGTIGTQYGSWQAEASRTTPEADDLARSLAAMRERGATYAAMEVSSHALALDRVRGLRFRVAVFTNLTQDHLDFHGTMSRYGEAKARLFTELGPGAAVINVGDPFGRSLAERVRAPLVRVSCHADVPADVAPVRCRLAADGIEALVRTPAGEVTLASRLIGEHNLENLLVALGIAHALELEMPRAAAALSAQPGVPGRLERCDAADDDIVALVDYAHTPDALSRALHALRAVSGSRKLWCVFGCGGDRDPTKRGPMGEAVARGADLAVVTSDNPRSEDPSAIADAVVKGVRAAGREPIVELDRRKAIDLAIRSASAGDVVLVAGKGHEDYQVVGSVVNPFDDRIETRRALERRRHSRGGG
jgi:UDP-N-acetylmuramoyl-L-alanyl-D-glutamate--2,6-diaminopimelate ligase